MIIDGKKISTEIKDELKEQVAKLKAEGVEVTLAVVKVGEDPASAVYVRNKEKACEYIGINSKKIEMPEETTEEELLKLVNDLNADPAINGILVQLPLPKHIQPRQGEVGFEPTTQISSSQLSYSPYEYILTH